MKICDEIDNYINFVRKPGACVCEEQLLLCDLVEKVFTDEDIRVNEGQLARYLANQKYFPFELLPWEKFCFALHNCAYRADGELRFPRLIIKVGRGAGKNGYLAFEDFCMITPINGVKYYNIDIFATSEAQAKTTPEDIYNILEDSRDYFKNYFTWNLEVIKNIKTGSKIRYHTRAPGTKDGGRPGKVDFDEYHAYENYKLIEVATTGLGKTRHPRITIVTTEGDVRDGPMDNLTQECEDILHGRIPDNGKLPFICQLDSDEEVEDEKNWQKANPSLIYFPHLMREMRAEYEDYKRDPANHGSFMTKRMNRKRAESDYNVTDWENLVAATKPLPDLKGRSCVAGIDFAKSRDFVSAGLLFKENGRYYWIHHTWVCKKSKDLKRIRYPLEEAEMEGVLEYVDDLEFDPRDVTEWLAEKGRDYIIEAVALDDYRFILVKDALKEIGFTPEKKNIKLVRPSDKIKVSITIGHIFSKQLLTWGTSKIMRWYTWNVKETVDKKGNAVYEKQEEKARKTDGFFAFVAAMTIEHMIRLRPKLKNRMGTIC